MHYNYFHLKMVNIAKYFYLIFIIIYSSCSTDYPQFRVEKDIKNQKEINFIQENCKKYQNNQNLSSCIKKAKKSFQCLEKIDYYLKNLKLQSNISCRSESNKRFPYNATPKIEEEKFQLTQEDYDLIQENIDIFLARDQIFFRRYNPESKKYEGSATKKTDNNHKERFTTHYSRNEFIHKCQKNFDDRKELFKDKYIKKCYSIL
jgi:hypothetical protein